MGLAAKQHVADLLSVYCIIDCLTDQRVIKRSDCIVQEQSLYIVDRSIFNVEIVIQCHRLISGQVLDNIQCSCIQLRNSHIGIGNDSESHFIQIREAGFPVIWVPLYDQFFARNELLIHERASADRVAVNICFVCLRNNCACKLVNKFSVWLTQVYLNRLAVRFDHNVFKNRKSGPLTLDARISFYRVLNIFSCDRGSVAECNSIP